MKIRLFHASEDGFDWVLAETFEGGLLMPSPVITRNGKMYWWNSSLNEKDEYILDGLCYCEASACPGSPITAY